MDESAAGVDPRTIITPDAFTVAPELLGLPLAHPWRRAVAILVDLLLIAILANAPAVFLAFAIGLFVFWLAVRRPSRTGRVRRRAERVARVSLGCLGALTLTIASLVIWASIFVDPEAQFAQMEFEGPGGEDIGFGMAGISDFVALARGGDSAEVAAAARRMVERLEAQDVATEEMRDVVDEMEFDPDVEAIVEAAIAEAELGSVEERPAVDTLSVDTLLARLGAARAAGDTLAMERLGPALGVELAAGELAERASDIRRLERRNESLDTELEETQADLEEERNRGIVATVVALLDDFGLGLGWSGLYFTFFLGWWRGHTPGKRLLRIRVIRLDGRSLGYWASFERYGGYAASLFTGLEGFLRILWDRNRQALEDKLAETVVIDNTPETRRSVDELQARRAAADAEARRPLGARLGFRSGAD